MPTDTAQRSTAAARFALSSIAISVACFGLLRLAWVETYLLLPLTSVQAIIAEYIVGAPTAPIVVTLACSGAEALAVCFGATLAYPVTGRLRLAGAAGGAALILMLNTLRIGSLGRVAASPAQFDLLHLYLWPALLAIVIVGYVFAWIHVVDRQATSQSDPREARTDPRPWRPALSRRFVVTAFAFVVAYAAASPLYLDSPRVLALAGLVVRAAAATLAVFGVSTYAAANVLRTAHGEYLVTQECVATPLIPLYLAMVLAYSSRWWQVVAGIGGVIPVFFFLAIMRLMAVALPAAAGPIFFVHAFHQLLLAVLVVFAIALFRHGAQVGPARALLGLAVGVSFAYVIGPWHARAITYPSGPPVHDPQDAIAMLPAFQAGLYLALCFAGFVAIAWGRVIAGFAALSVTQVAALFFIHALSAHAGMALFVPAVRGWAIAAPLLIFMAVAGVRTPR